MRSKKSATWKAKQGPLKSVFKEVEDGADSAVKVPPEIFTRAARKFVEVVRSELDENETRALAADKVASPTLQVGSFSDSHLNSSLKMFPRCYSQWKQINR